MNINDNIVSIDSDNISSLNNLINNGENIIDITIENSTDSYQGLKQNNIYSIDRVENGLKEVKSNIKNALTIMNNYYEKVSSINDNGISKIDAITIPKSFSLNDVCINNDINNVYLNKNDGISINSVSFTNNQVTIESNNNEKDVNLENISNPTTLKESKYDISSIIEKGDLSNMSKYFDKNIKRFDDNYKNINDDQLISMNNNTDNEQVSLDESTSINSEKNIFNINNNINQQKVELDEFNIINNQDKQNEEDNNEVENE